MHKNKIASKIRLVIIITFSNRVLLFSGIMIKNPGGFFSGDSYEYWKIADNLVHHNTYSIDVSAPLTPDHKRTPIYPFYISLFILIGLGPTSVIFFQILIIFGDLFSCDFYDSQVCEQLECFNNCRWHICFRFSLNSNV